jgi:hypothetical protein
MTGRVGAGEIKSMFREWVIPHKGAIAAIEKMEEMRAEKRRNRWDSEASGAYILQKSQSGKSHTVNNAYFYKHVIPQCRATGTWAEDLKDEEIKRLQRNVLYFKTPPKPNLGAFGTDLLKSLHSNKFPANVWEKISLARDLMRNGGLELFILDSFDHLTRKHDDAKTQNEASQVQDALKTVLEYGIPILFVGLPSAESTLTKQFQVAHRVDKIAFDRIDWHTDFEEFRTYVAWINEYMVSSGIFDDYADLESDDILQRLFYGCRRQYGILSNILREAAKIGSAARAKRLDVNHLSLAFDQYVVGKNIRPLNAFKVSNFALETDLDDDTWDIGISVH